MFLLLAAGAARAEGPSGDQGLTTYAIAMHGQPALPADFSRLPYADPQAPYKADRLSWSRGQPVVNVPGQTTVLTRQVLDDMNATSLRDAMRSTAGVTVGR